MTGKTANRDSIAPAQRSGSAPRLINIFGPDKPKPAPMSRRRRAAIAADAEPDADRNRLHKTIGHDGKTRYWVEGEAMPINRGNVTRFASDAVVRKHAVTFDGALPCDED